MRHGKKLLKLGRTWQTRLHLLRNLTTALIEHQRIRTTPARAKAVRGFADRMVSLAKKENLTDARKRVLLGAFLYSKSSVEKVMTELLPRFKGFQGNYTRVRKDGWRRGDGSDMATIEYRGNPYEMYELEREKEKPIAKMPEFEFRLLKQEKKLYETKLEEYQQTVASLEQAGEKTPADSMKVSRAKDQVRFFLRQLDRVQRELAYFREETAEPAKQVAA